MIEAFFYLMISLCLQVVVYILHSKEQIDYDEFRYLMISAVCWPASMVVIFAAFIAYTIRLLAWSMPRS